MSDLNSDAGDLVRAAREERGLSDEERARVRAGILAATTAGALGTAGAAAAKTGVVKALGLVTAGQWSIVATLTVAGAAALYASTRAEPPPSTRSGQQGGVPTAAHPELPGRKPDEAQSSQVPEVAASPRVPLSTLANSLGDGGARAPRTRHVEPKPRTPALAPSADTSFVEDARLLREVRVELAAGSGDRALALLDARSTKGGSGVFAEEREAARILVLCKLGRQSEARIAASRFLAAHPSSPLSERVRRACPDTGSNGAPR